MERAELGVGTSEQQVCFISYVIGFTDVTDRRSTIGPSSLFNSKSGYLQPEPGSVAKNVMGKVQVRGCPNGTGSSARHQRRPEAVLVHSILGRPAHLDPTYLPCQDRDIHLIELKFCPDTTHFPTLEAATTHHASTLTRLTTCSLKTQTGTTGWPCTLS
eukprot:1156727-Pelagomonas_calceolata.AAC.3